MNFLHALLEFTVGFFIDILAGALLEAVLALLGLA